MSPPDRLRALLELGHRVGIAVVCDLLDPLDQRAQPTRDKPREHQDERDADDVGGVGVDPQGQPIEHAASAEDVRRGHSPAKMEE
jgi:hypothetical protein